MGVEEEDEDEEVNRTSGEVVLGYLLEEGQCGMRIGNRNCLLQLVGTVPRSVCCSIIL